MATVDWNEYNTTDGNWYATEINGVQLIVADLTSDDDGSEYGWRNNLTGIARKCGTTNTLAEAMTAAIRSITN